MKFCATHVTGTSEHRISPWFDTSVELAAWIGDLDIWTTSAGGYVTCNYRATEGEKMPQFTRSGYYVFHGMLARAGGAGRLLAGPFSDTASAKAAKEWATAQAAKAGLPTSGDGYVRLSVEVAERLPRGIFTPAGNLFSRPVQLPGLM